MLVPALDRQDISKPSFRILKVPKKIDGKIFNTA